MIVRRTYIHILIFCVINVTISCVGPQWVTLDEIMEPNSKKFNKVNQEYIILKNQKTQYRVLEYSFENNYFKGKVMPYTYEKGTFLILKTKANIFDPEKLDPNNVLTLSYREIDNYMIKTISSANTVEAMILFVELGIGILAF